MTGMITDERLSRLEKSLGLLIECLAGPSEPKPAHRVANLAISDAEVRQVLAPQEHALDARMRVCPRVAREQIAWNMLMAAQRARVDGRPLSTTALCSFAHAPPTTALRWLELLVKEELLTSNPDHSDARRRWIALSAKGVLMFKRYAAELRG